MQKPPLGGHTALGRGLREATKRGRPRRDVPPGFSVHRPYSRPDDRGSQAVRRLWGNPGRRAASRVDDGPPVQNSCGVWSRQCTRPVARYPGLHCAGLECPQRVGCCPRISRPGGTDGTRTGSRSSRLWTSLKVKGFGRRPQHDSARRSGGRRSKASLGGNRGQDMALFGRARPMGI